MRDQDRVHLTPGWRLHPGIALGVVALLAVLLSSPLGRPEHAAAQAPLAVTSIAPNYGPAVGGTRVTLTGTGFSTRSGVTQFSAGSFQFTNVFCVSTTRCTALSPPVHNVSVGSVLFGDPISVTVNRDIAQNWNLFFAWYGQPQLNALHPSSGPAAGGTHVELSGATFPSGVHPGTVAVHFGAIAVTSAVCPNTGTCIATAPPGSGTVQVTITTPGGTSNGLRFTYSSGTPALAAPPAPAPPRCSRWSGPLALIIPWQNCTG